MKPTRVLHSKTVAHSVLGFKAVEFTGHALTRMKERDVSQDEVFGVLESPDKKALPTQPGRFRWRKCKTDVVFEKWPDKLCIVTVIISE